jgi:hypothetical protein
LLDRNLRELDPTPGEIGVERKPVYRVVVLVLIECVVESRLQQC